MDRPIRDLVNLIDPASQRLHGLGPDAAAELLWAGDPRALSGLSGSWALLARSGETVRMARSLDRPMRYFLAKQEAGPLLVVADRIDAIRAYLEEVGYGDQFHPSYTRMVPAHHVTTLRLVGCPDPNPRHERFVAPAPEALPEDLDLLGERYVGALLAEVREWLEAHPAPEPIGVLFSGGVDSGSVLLALYHELLRRGESPARLKAFTLRVDGGGGDAEQALEALRRLDLEVFGEVLDVPAETIDVEAAIRTIEDYKPLDVECAAVNLALLAAIRERYPDWRLLADGDGGDENLKDYPIEANTELTIRSVVNNPMLYQEGWGVDAIKHSLTYSGGYSRACVRTWAPAARLGFEGFSPYTRPRLVAIAAAMPFADLAQGSEERLYGLKGEIVGRGLARLTGHRLPLFPKRRFQEGAVSGDAFHRLFRGDEAGYRRIFQDLYPSDR
ncbi:MAG: asparagine synthase-related protein [Thermoanaerobaculia bacterium]